PTGGNSQNPFYCGTEARFLAAKIEGNRDDSRRRKRNVDERGGARLGRALPRARDCPLLALAAGSCARDRRGARVDGADGAPRRGGAGGARRRTGGGPP